MWEDPPHHGRPISEYLTPEQEQALTANPGRWARVTNFASKSGAGQAASKCRKGKTRLDPAEWEFAARRVEGDRSALYIRRRA